MMAVALSTPPCATQSLHVLETQNVALTAAVPPLVNLLPHLTPLRAPLLGTICVKMECADHNVCHSKDAHYPPHSIARARKLLVF